MREDIREKLLEMREEKYRDFDSWNKRRRDAWSAFACTS